MAKVTLLKNRNEIAGNKEVRWDQNGIPRRSKIRHLMVPIFSYCLTWKFAFSIPILMALIG